MRLGRGLRSSSALVCARFDINLSDRQKVRRWPLSSLSVVGGTEMREWKIRYGRNCKGGNAGVSRMERQAEIVSRKLLVTSLDLSLLMNKVCLLLL